MFNIPATETGLTRNQADARYVQLLIDVSATPAANKIPRADDNGLLNDWIDLGAYATVEDLTGYAVDGHTHNDRYYTETEADERFAAIVHDHDVRYYTQTNIDNLLTALLIDVSTDYAPISHFHAASDITSGVLDNARVNWAAPGNFGSTTPAQVHANYLNVHVQEWAGGSELYGHATADHRGHMLTFYRSRGTQVSPTAAQSGDTLGYISWNGHDGTDYGGTAAQIQVVAGQTYEVGKRATFMDFYTTAVDAASATLKMRILGSGKVVISPNFNWNTARLNVGFVSGETGLILRSQSNDAPHFQLQNSSGVVGLQASNDAYGLEFLRNGRTQKHRYQVYFDDTSGTLLYQSYNAVFSGGAWTRDNTAKEGVLQFMGNYNSYGDRALIGWFNITGTAPTTTVVPVMSISTIEPGVRIGNFTDGETNTAYGAQLFVRGRDTTLIPVRIRQSAGGTQEIFRVENAAGSTAYMSVIPSSTTFTHGINATAFSVDVTSNTAYLAYYLRNQDTGVNAAAQIVFGNNQGGSRMQIGVRGGNYTATANQAGVGYMGMGNETALVFYHGAVESLRLNRQTSTFRMESAHTTTAQATWFWQARTTNTPANGFGFGHVFQLQTSTAQDQNAATIDVSWSDATHASRVGQIIFNVYNVSTKTPVLTLTPTSVLISTALDVNSNTFRLRTARTPASASATGNQGEIAWDSSYIYVCTATNTWRRIAHATW